MAQGGDITLGNGMGGESIYGESFAVGVPVLDVSAGPAGHHLQIVGGTNCTSLCPHVLALIAAAAADSHTREAAFAAVCIISRGGTGQRQHICVQLGSFVAACCKSVLGPVAHQPQTFVFDVVSLLP